MTADLPKVLICRISWMHEYHGLTNDAIRVPAGDFPKKNGWGGECWNFRTWRGRMYGYARVNPRADPAPVVRRLNSGTDADSVDGVTVVWVAHTGSIDETFVIGWFERSKICGQKFLRRPDAQRIAGETRKAGVDIKVDQEELKYFVTCNAEDARLLAEGERTFRVPTGKGWMSRQHLLFYPDGGAKHEKFKGRLLDYIAATSPLAHGSQTAVPYSAVDELVDGRGKLEGEQVIVTHFQSERDTTMVKRAKNRFRRKHGRLFCEACKFDFQAKYGALGKGFIEAHHVTPLSEGPRYNSPDDLMMLCANCHRMVHREIILRKRSLTRDEAADIATRST